MCHISRYSAFAELFCDAIKCGLPALQTQHPGIYYHKAAEYLGKRKDAYLDCVANGSAATEPLAPNTFYSEFFGVRSTKIGDPITEQQVVAAVQANEKGFNHSVSTYENILMYFNVMSVTASCYYASGSSDGSV